MRVIVLLISFFFIFTINSVLLGQVQQEWVSRYSPSLIIDDYGNSIAVDGAGNIYITGSSPAGQSGYDYTTIKYNSSGVQQWIQIYDGTGNSNDYANSIAVDGLGNVFVTGRSYGNGTGYDYATIKYNSDGVLQWVKRYDDGDNNIDEAIFITVDISGNVYVTGTCYGNLTNFNCVTIKYNSSGVQQWVQIYNTSGPYSIDNASALTVDGTGNVYVTGSSMVSYAGGYDYATIKYNSSGVQQWVQRYNSTYSSEDYASSIAVDGSGNVFVTGSSYATGSGFDYVTIRYNSSGVQQWLQRYNGPAGSHDNAFSLALDNTGNVYITGSSSGNGTNFDYATLKYNTSGIQQWVQRYNGPENTCDSAISLVVDGSGNVYVTGYSRGTGSNFDFATIKYNTSGNQQWVQRYNGTGNSTDNAYSIKVDGSGNVYVAGSSIGIGTSSDYAAVKYNSSGVQQWVQTYNGACSKFDEACSITTDAVGNTYVTGYSYNIFSGCNYTTIKYNSSGVQQWLSIYNGSGNSLDFTHSIALDGSGNVYVTGSSRGDGTFTDYLTLKYSSSGGEIWGSRYNGPGNAADGASTVKIDGTGNVYVTGGSTGNGTYTDYATIKYNSSGVQQWVQRYNGPGNLDDYANFIIADASGNVYITGESCGNGSNYDYATIKYNYAGTQLWIQRYNGPGNSLDLAEALVVDGTGNVYVTGRSTGNGTNYDYATIKYNATGVQQWVQRYNGPGNSFDGATSMAFDSTGNIYVTGGGTGIGTGVDFVTIKYNLSGVQQWVQTYSYSGSSSDDATAIALDATGNIYVTGTITISGTNTDYATIKYNPGGVQQWVITYNGPANDYDNANSIVVDGSGNVYVTGGSTGNGTGLDYATIKYNQQIGIKPISEIIPHEFMLYQNYPNPFNPTTKIKFDLPKKSDVKFFVYDVLGREKTYINYGELNAGTYEFEWNGNLQSSGVYFYKILAGNFIAVRKMLLIK